MRKLKRIILLFCGLALIAFLSGCEQEGPAEKAGEKIDKAVDKTQQTMEEAGEKMHETVEKAGEKIEETGEKMQQ